MYNGILFYAHETKFGSYSDMHHEVTFIALDYGKAVAIPKTLKCVRKHCKHFNKLILPMIVSGGLDMDPAEAFIKTLGAEQTDYYA